jgi:nucleoside phosphorylase
MSKRRLIHEDYTVGWICSSEVEQVAALEMLDEEHERLTQSLVDHNVYTLGSIGGHNVVISGLHAPGNNPAATAVTQMRNTFQRLRFGLLVGIGGGVPTKTDRGMIRLGNVVVSKPTGEHSGAIQYDHGKAEKFFRRTGYLTPPPSLLLNAAQDLAVQCFRTYKNPMAENIKRIMTNIPEPGRYEYPGLAQDHLYKPDYNHRDPEVSCDECGCDPAQRVRRPIDGMDDENPNVVIHRGTIASGELVIKNGVLRDEVAKQHGILCFETEAAGALTDFPCMVIRGISDYCDSHKNDRWNGYAAVAAAAYARELFFHLPLLRDAENRYGTATAAAYAVEESSKNSPTCLGRTDVEDMLERLAQNKGVRLNWKTSIIDLLKLLELDSSSNARELLAEKLNIHAGPHRSYEQNDALRIAMMEVLTKNNGRVPEEIRN